MRLFGGHALAIGDGRPWGAAEVATVSAVLAIHAGLLARAATKHSPTLNEPGQLVAGLSHWELGRFDVGRVNPPLVRLVAALPVLAAGYKADWSRLESGSGDRPEYGVGADFIRANGERSVRLFALARCACIPFGVLGGAFCFLWGRALYGTAAGLASLCLWCFDPNVLAHAELITTDAAAAALGTGAGYTFWRWLKAPGWGRAGLAGVLLGLAELAKMSWVFLFLLWPVVWVVVGRVPKGRTDAVGAAPPPAGGGFRRQIRGKAAQLLLILLLAVYVLNAGYAFGGTFTRLGEFPFVSEALGAGGSGNAGNRFAGGALASLPVPLPRDYALGLDSQQRDFESWTLPSYLRGAWRDGGWWYYYLYGLLVKVPHGTQVLVVLAAGASVCGVAAARRSDEVMLLTPAVCLFALVSAQTAFNHHFRYVLPAFGPVFVFAGKAVAAGVSAWGRGMCSRVTTAVPVAAVLASAASGAAVYPHTLAYFNEGAGGPREGHRHLLHSSLDWGQDLLFLKEYAAAEGAGRPLYFVGHGHYRPADLGVPVVPASATLVANDSRRPARQATCAISVNVLCGDRRPVLAGASGGKGTAVVGGVPLDRVALLPRVGASLVLVPCSVPASADSAAHDVTEAGAGGERIVIDLGRGTEETR